VGAVRSYAWVETQLVLVRQWVDEHGLLDEDGKPRTVLTLLETGFAGVQPSTRGRRGVLKRLFTLGLVVMLAAAFTVAGSSPIANAAPPLPKVTVAVDAVAGGCGSVSVTGDWTAIAGQ
jgi:hypothetical protein